MSSWQVIFFYLQQYNINDVPNKTVDECGCQLRRYLSDAWTSTSAYLFLKIIRGESCFLTGQSVLGEIHFWKVLLCTKSTFSSTYWPTVQLLEQRTMNLISLPFKCCIWKQTLCPFFLNTFFFLFLQLFSPTEGSHPSLPWPICPRVHIYTTPHHVCHLKHRCEILSSRLSVSFKAC